MAKTENFEIIQALHGTIQTLLESHGADASSLEKFAAIFKQDLALAPFFVKTMTLVRSLELDAGKVADLSHQIRSFFMPFLMDLDLVGAASTGIGSADTNGGEVSASDDGEGGKRGRRRTAVPAAAATKKIKAGSVAAAKCLVKSVSEAQTLYSSLPKNLNAGEFDLVDTITEMEILPTSFANIRKSQKVGGLADISPAVARPSHAPRLAKSFIQKREEMRLTSFLDFGAYCSFGPSYDSTDAVLGYHETVEYYTSLLALRQYEQPHIMKNAPEALHHEASKESTQGSQTMLTDVFPEDKVEQWTKDGHRVASGSPKKAIGTAELEDYLETAGIDLDGLLEQHNAPPSQHEFGTILSHVGDNLAMLASLQDDRYNTTRLSAESLATLYSLAVPASSQATHPLTEIRDSITIKPTAQAKAQIEQLTLPSVAEKVVYQSLVKDLLRCVPHVAPSALVKPSAIRKLMKNGLQSTEDYVVRGSMSHSDRAPPVLPSQVIPDGSAMLSGHHQQMVANQLTISGQQQQQQFMAQQFAQGMRAPNPGWPTMPNGGMPAGAPMWNPVGAMKGTPGIVQIGRTAPPNQPARQ